MPGRKGGRRGEREDRKKRVDKTKKLENTNVDRAREIDTAFLH